MGRHTDKESIKFIDEILRLGNEFGFITKDEYNVQGYYYIDVVWKLTEEAPPYITFEIESRSPSNIINNVLKIFATPTEVLEKPQKHFAIIMRGQLSKGNRFKIFDIENRNNIVILEDFLNSEKTREKFHEQIHLIGESIKGPIIKLQNDQIFFNEFKNYLNLYFEISEINYRKKRDDEYYIIPYIEKIVPKIENNDIKLVGSLFSLYYDALTNNTIYADSNYFINNEFIELLKKCYEKRPIILHEIINNFGHLFMKYWINSDSRKANTLSHVVLRLCVELINQDISIIKNSFRILDNVSSDYFLPSLMAKQIMLVSLMDDNLIDKILVNNYSKDISINDEFAWDAMYYSYLRDSIYQAEKEQNRYNINISKIKEEYLNTYLVAHMNDLIESFISFLGESEYDDINFELEFFENIVSSYEFLNKNIISEIEKRVYETNNTEKINILCNVLSNSNLVKIIKSRESRFTIPYIVELLIDSNTLKFINIGLNLGGLTHITFFSGVSDMKIKAIQQLLLKYHLSEDDLSSDNGLSLELDPLWFQDKSNYEFKLSRFLTELNDISRIKELYASATYQFRDQGEEKE